ncbi:hypothetical protein Q9233_010459, partial [Columba guinea]
MAEEPAELWDVNKLIGQISSQSFDTRSRNENQGKLLHVNVFSSSPFSQKIILETAGPFQEVRDTSSSSCLCQSFPEQSLWTMAQGQHSMAKVSPELQRTLLSMPKEVEQDKNILTTTGQKLLWGSRKEAADRGRCCSTTLSVVTCERGKGALLCVPSQAVHEIINQALEKLEEMQVLMPDYALKSAGAAVILSKTSPSLRTAKAKVFLYSLPVMDYMRSPELILEPDNHPGNCWPFPGSQGHVFIKLSMPVVPRAVTMAHVSGTAFHGESISGAPKDFAVYGFKEEHEEQGTFLGQFTFLAALNPSQTFQLK